MHIRQRVWCDTDTCFSLIRHISSFSDTASPSSLLITCWHFKRPSAHRGRGQACNCRLAHLLFFDLRLQAEAFIMIGRALRGILEVIIRRGQHLVLLVELLVFLLQFLICRHKDIMLLDQLVILSLESFVLRHQHLHARTHAQGRVGVISVRGSMKQHAA